jgi:hypothetical protein
MGNDDWDTDDEMPRGVEERTTTPAMVEIPTVTMSPIMVVNTRMVAGLVERLRLHVQHEKLTKTKGACTVCIRKDLEVWRFKNFGGKEVFFCALCRKENMLFPCHFCGTHASKLVGGKPACTKCPCANEREPPPKKRRVASAPPCPCRPGDALCPACEAQMLKEAQEVWGQEIEDALLNGETVWREDL